MIKLMVKGGKRMNALKISLLTVMVTAFALGMAAGVAVGASVIINHAGGTLEGTLSSQGLKVDSNGNVTVYIVEDLTGGGGTCTNRPPTITVTNPPSVATVGTQISASFTTSEPDGQNVTVTANVGTISGNTWSWTPSTTGSYTVKLTADDGQSCNNKAEYSWSVNVSSSTGGGGEPPGTITLQYAKETGDIKLPKRGTLYFKAQLDSPCPTTTRGQLIIKAIGYSQFGRPDLVVKKSNNGTESWPTKADYDRLIQQYPYLSGPQKDGNFFVNFIQDYGGETVPVNKTYSDTPDFNQADIYYIMLYNNSDYDTTIHMYYSCK